MTQKEKIIKAVQLGVRLRSLANSLKEEAHDYDLTFVDKYVCDITSISKELCGLLK